MQKPKEAVACIIFDLNHEAVLLIKRMDVPVWVLPGGGIESKETSEEAVLREVLEETGFHIKIERKIAEYLPVNRLTQYTHFFEGSIISGKATIGKETREVLFFPLTALPKLLPPPYKSWIMDACAHSAQMIKKKISGVSYLILIKFLCVHPLLTLRFLLTKINIHLNIQL